MKKILLGALWCATVTVYGQTINELIHAEYQPKEDLAQGHPYLFEEVINGNLKTSAGEVETVMIRYNLADNNLLATVNGKEFVLKKYMVESFTLSKSDGKRYRFVTFKMSSTQYFGEQLFDDGSVKFLKWYRKVFMKGQSQMGYSAYSNGPDSFAETTAYIFVIDGETIEYELKKDELLKVLAKDNAELKTFLSDTMKKQKLKAKDEDDVITLLKAREEYLKK